MTPPPAEAALAPIPAAFENLMAVRPPRPVPTTAFQDASGAPITLAKFKGKPVVLNFWATWCPPCIKEMPSLNNLQKNTRDLQVVAVSEDRGGIKVAKEFLTRQSFAQLRPYADETGALARAFGVRGLPTTIIIDQMGREVGRLEGAAEWDSQTAITAIQALLLPPKPAEKS